MNNDTQDWELTGRIENVYRVVRGEAFDFTFDGTWYQRPRQDQVR